MRTGFAFLLVFLLACSDGDDDLAESPDPAASAELLVCGEITVSYDQQGRYSQASTGGQRCCSQADPRGGACCECPAGTFCVFQHDASSSPASRCAPPWPGEVR